MRLLLDTHVWLWSFLEPQRIAKTASGALANRHNELWLSSLTIWELFLLAEKGRISLSPTTQEWVLTALGKVRIKEAPLTSEVVLATKHIELSHSDPVDRFLAATARAFDLTLVTADRRLLSGKGFSVMSND